MQPAISGDVINARRQAYSNVGDVTIDITWHIQNYYNKLEITQK
jgi:hypothetical protein